MIIIAYVVMRKQRIEEERNNQSSDFWGVLTRQIVLPSVHKIKHDDFIKFPRAKYDKKRREILDECPICLENYKDGEDIIILPCRHIYHISFYLF